MSKRVLLTNYYADMGGGEFALLAHAEYLISHDYDVCVCLFNSGSLKDRLNKIGTQVEVVGVSLKCGPRKSKLVGFFLQFRLRKIIKKFKPDFILDYTLHELPFFIEAANNVGVPIIYRDQGAVWGNDKNTDWRELKLTEWCNKGLSGIICTTQRKYEHHIRNGSDKKKLRSVYLGTDKGKFSETQDREALISELGLPGDALLAGIFGRLIQWKGQASLIEAFAQVKNKNAHLLIVGGPQLNNEQGEDYLAHLKQLVADHGLDGRVHFLGFRDDIPFLMECCDVVCHASIHEPFGLVLVEAMMAGKPVIASDVSGPQEIVVEGETGFLVKPGDHTQYADRLNLLLNDTRLRSAFGTQGRLRAEQLFDLQSNLAALQSEIESILSVNAGLPQEKI